MPPVSVEVDDRAAVHELRFTWVYQLETRQECAPDGWHWQSLTDLDLPALRACLKQAGERLVAPSP